MARGMAEAWPERERLFRAQMFCAALVEEYSRLECGRLQVDRLGSSCDTTRAPVSTDQLNRGEIALAHALAEQLTRFDQAEALYLVGTVYTVLLPKETRSRLGAYYTPPCLVERLLDQVTKLGFDWRQGSILDPACGGGAFLAPIALRMASALEGAEPALILSSISHRLRGYEIDSFAGWISQALLEICLMPICIAARKRLPQMVMVVDSLAQASSDKFDLVVGNPPYGKVSLSVKQRNRYKRSLYGHANLYGLFTDFALRCLRDDGVLAYVTPTSFLGGQYFKALRRLLLEESRPCSFEFVSDREGVFDDALQETMLATYRKDGLVEPCRVFSISPRSLSRMDLVDLGSVNLPATGDQAWVMPREGRHKAMAARMSSMSTRLSDLGYSVSTGQLVWNRHKLQLRMDKDGRRTYPLVWAEAVRAGSFSMQYSKANHLPYIEVPLGQEWLLMTRQCILCQRTTSKEQERRLIAAVLPRDLVGEGKGGVVVENHLNMIIPEGGAKVSPATISALLNSEAVDSAFRCISGSVAVSAYELNSLPLPSLDELVEIEGLVLGRASSRTIEATLHDIYGL